MSAGLAVEQVTQLSNTGSLAPTIPEILRDVPVLLRNLPNWVAWRLETVNGRATKVPYVAGTNWTRRASSTNPTTWTTFDAAATGVELSDNQGIGFVIQGEAVEQQIVGFDLDGCLNPATGELTSWAHKLINLLCSYAEVTPSKTGLRIWVRGVLPSGARVFNLSPKHGYGSKVKIEIYDSARYFTVTGEMWDFFFPEIVESDLEKAYEMCLSIQAEYGLAKQTQTTPTELTSKSGVQIVGTGTVVTSKRELLMHGTIVSTSPFIVEDDYGKSLTFPSHSEADLALCTALALDGLDAEQIDEQFRESVLCGEDRLEKWDRLSQSTIAKAIKTAGRVKTDEGKEIPSPPSVLVASAVACPLSDEEEIPPFDLSVVNGIYKEFVDVVTKGTTLAPQFAYVIAKTIVGIRMAGRVKFDLLDAEPRYYTTLIGETGSGKGEAWRRTLPIIQSTAAVDDCGFKIINSADSGVGIKDLFFEPPNQPIVCYVDEVASLGNKASETRNPGIVDTMIELADSTSISRVLANRKGGGSKTKHDARFAMVICGQDGDVYMKAFAGRTKLGWWDRCYPEYGVPQETGDLPPVDQKEAIAVLMKLHGLDYSAEMKMSSEARDALETFWSGQPIPVRKKARWKKNLMMDAYMSAFGRSVKTVSSEDAQIAIKIFIRQGVIRRLCFKEEAPDQVGVYLGRLKAVTQRMVKRLAAGADRSQVAKSRRDFETESNAFRDNELHIFARAWDAYARGYLTKVTVVRENGRQYEKYLPADHDG